MHFARPVLVKGMHSFVPVVYGISKEVACAAGRDLSFLSLHLGSLLLDEGRLDYAQLHSRVEMCLTCTYLATTVTAICHGVGQGQQRAKYSNDDTYQNPRTPERLQKVAQSMQIAAQYMHTQDLNRPDSTDNWFKKKVTFARIAQSPQPALEFSRCMFIYCNRE